MSAVASSVETVAHVIQIALTPVFLFSGVATLLSVLSTRLGRVADRVDALSDKLESADAREQSRLSARFKQLRWRTQILDFSVIMAAMAGMSTLLAAGLLFVEGLRDSEGATTLVIAFGCALALTVAALGGFLYEMMLSSVGIRHLALSKSREAEAAEPAEAPEAEESTQQDQPAESAPP